MVAWRFVVLVGNLVLLERVNYFAVVIEKVIGGAATEPQIRHNVSGHFLNELNRILISPAWSALRSEYLQPFVMKVAVRQTLDAVRNLECSAEAGADCEHVRIFQRELRCAISAHGETGDRPTVLRTDGAKLRFDILH